MGRQDYQWRHEPCLYGWKQGAPHYFTQLRNKTTVIEDEIDFSKLKKADLVNILTQTIEKEANTTIIRVNKPLKNGEHPTMKPVVLIADLMSNSSRPNEIISDPFLGSGTTMVAAHQLNRRCYGMEIDPKYCQVIVDRMLKLDPTLEIKRNGQPYNKTGK